ncbi:transcriptional repressor LexA [Patescibacteria group bacterium]|nr:transcriptional repressor LexA [Patescibacteria group bacterium]MBU4579570.1 transcriptional repressor LexA [Patescibacteria group bacterium]
MSKNITQKQKKVLEFIYETIKSSGYPPTLAEIKEMLGVSSNQSVLNFLVSLEKKGYLKKEENIARGLKILPLGFKILEKDALFPIAGKSAAGAYIDTVEIFGEWMILPGAIEKEIVKQSKEDVFVIQVHGDSMINAGINNGNILLVRKTREFRSGDIVVARSDDGTTVKRFIAEADGRSYLKPENPAYKNIPIFEDTIFDGKVIMNLSLINKNHE